MDEKPPTPEELRQAEALARALEGEGSAPDLPEDALSVAALLRYSRDGGTLPGEPMAAIREEILESARARASKVQPAGARKRWLAPAGVLLGAGASLVLLLVLARVPAPPLPTELPPPTAQLLQAQMGAARGDAQAFTELSRQMRTYRGLLYDALSEHYVVTQ